MIYPVHISDEKYEDRIDLLLIIDDNKSHCVHIEGFNRFMYNKTKHRNKKHFCRYCLQCFVSAKVLVEHKEVYLKINGKQRLKLRNELIGFNNHAQQLPV